MVWPLFAVCIYSAKRLKRRAGYFCSAATPCYKNILPAPAESAMPCTLQIEIDEFPPQRDGNSSISILVQLTGI